MSLFEKIPYVTLSDLDELPMKTKEMLIGFYLLEALNKKDSFHFDKYRHLLQYRTYFPSLFKPFSFLEKGFIPLLLKIYKNRTKLKVEFKDIRLDKRKSKKGQVLVRTFLKHGKVGFLRISLMQVDSTQKIKKRLYYGNDLYLINVSVIVYSKYTWKKAEKEERQKILDDFLDKAIEDKQKQEKMLISKKEKVEGKKLTRSKKSKEEIRQKIVIMLQDKGIVNSNGVLTGNLKDLEKFYSDLLGKTFKCPYCGKIGLKVRKDQKTCGNPRCRKRHEREEKKKRESLEQLIL